MQLRPSSKHTRIEFVKYADSAAVASAHDPVMSEFDQETASASHGHKSAVAPMAEMPALVAAVI
jgi:hypothetical protein